MWQVIGRTPIWSSDDALSNHYASSVFKDGYVYGFHGRQEMGQSLRCIELKTQGEVQWNVDGYGDRDRDAFSVIVCLSFVKMARRSLLRRNRMPTVRMEGATLPATVRSYPAIADSRLFFRNEQSALAAYSLAAP